MTTKQKSHEERLKEEQEKVDSWNELYVEGQTVIVTKDGGETVATTTRAKAEVLCGTAVCWFRGISGAYMLDRARPI